MAQHIKDYSISNICKVKAIADCRLIPDSTIENNG